MSRPRQISDPVVKTRYCNDCREPVVGITDRGLVTWLDVTPLTLLMERIYHRGGRVTFLVQPRAGRTAWIDWRNPMTAQTKPARGVVLLQHEHQRPGNTKAPDPPWVISDYTVTTPRTTDTPPMF